MQTAGLIWADIGGMGSAWNV